MFCSNAPVHPKDGTNSLSNGEFLSHPASQLYGPRSPFMVFQPGTNTLRFAGVSQCYLLLSARADLEKDANNIPMLEVVGTPSSTSVVPGIASMGYDSCLC